MTDAGKRNNSFLSRRLTRLSAHSKKHKSNKQRHLVGQNPCREITLMGVFYFIRLTSLTNCCKMERHFPIKWGQPRRMALNYHFLFLSPMPHISENLLKPEAGKFRTNWSDRSKWTSFKASPFFPEIFRSERIVPFDFQPNWIFRNFWHKRKHPEFSLSASSVLRVPC